MRVLTLRSILALPLVMAAACAHDVSARQVPLGQASGSEVYLAPSLPGALVTVAEDARAVAPVPTATASEESDVAQSTGSSRAARRRAARQHENTFAAATQPAVPPDRAPALEPAKADTATDAVQAGPLLVYTASFLLSAYEVAQTQAALKDCVTGVGGFVSMQTDAQLTLRVPAAHFEQILLAIEQAGKVRARHIQALDVGDEYRDLELRLRTAELLRERLEAMLARADKVSDALQVQGELERIVREIEQLKGSLRSFNDRISYSTIVIEFRPETRPDIDDSDVFRLPFPFLDELGLHHLLELT